MNLHGPFDFKGICFSPVLLHLAFYSIWDFDDSNLQNMQCVCGSF